MSDIFLTAEWRKLLMLNYAVQPELLQPWLPEGVELDLWNNTCYVSLVGFMFQNVKVKGISIPWHTHFEEVNLRFYVIRRDPVHGDKRGVVFIREFVPKHAISWVANLLYKEPYQTVPMGHEWVETRNELQVSYQWIKGGAEHVIGVRTDITPIPLKAGSEAEFITEHYWGYGKKGHKTIEYQVEHPRWEVYPVQAWRCDVHFGAVYGPQFEFLNTAEPRSVFLAEGSPVKIYGGQAF